jgi:hypothetical protein
MGFDAYEQLAVDPGAVGDVARSILETPSQPGESYADTQYRSAQQAGATARIQAIKGKQWAARGVPSYQDMQGNTKPVVDDTGSPLSKLDPKHNIAYDSTGSPKKIDFDIGSGSPVLKDPFEGLETTTDSPSIRASAHTHFRSSPAIANPFKSPPFATNPPSVSLNLTTIEPPSTRCNTGNGPEDAISLPYTFANAQKPNRFPTTCLFFG